MHKIGIEATQLIKMNVGGLLMDYELGVLLYHCTKYGSVGFDIECSTQAILNAISDKISKAEAKQGFVKEARIFMSNELTLNNYIECHNTGDFRDYKEWLNEDKVDELFEEIWDSLTSN